MATTVTYNQREPFRGAGYNPAGDVDNEFGRGAGDSKTQLTEESSNSATYTEDNDE